MGKHKLKNGNSKSAARRRRKIKRKPVKKPVRKLEDDEVVGRVKNSNWYKICNDVYGVIYEYLNAKDIAYLRQFNLRKLNGDLDIEHAWEIYFKDVISKNIDWEEMIKNLNIISHPTLLHSLNDKDYWMKNCKLALFMKKKLHSIETYENLAFMVEYFWNNPFKEDRDSRAYNLSKEILTVPTSKVHTCFLLKTFMKLREDLNIPYVRISDQRRNQGWFLLFRNQGGF